MSFILKGAGAKSLEETYSGKAYISPVTGKTECVAFLQAELPTIGKTASWKEGKKVTKGELGVEAGTAIATFLAGKYPGPGTPRKHAAIYIEQDETGIWVLDQWADQGKVLKRRLSWVGGSNLSNDGSAFSVIEHE